MNLILGAGLAGLSASYHLGHENCLLLERQGHSFGHIASEMREGFTWDQGPHVSFTKHEYVRELFRRSVDSAFEDFPVCVGNYFNGHWIEHPAQTALHQVPEPQRSACLASFLQTRRGAVQNVPDNYQDWLDMAFGPVFTELFPSAYTQKYWTRPPADLTTAWIGNRVLFPDAADVETGASGPIGRPMHYINTIRYPKQGGYQSFAAGLKKGSNIRYGADVASVDLVRREVVVTDGRKFNFDTLVNTLPLPVFIQACRDVPEHVLDAARQLTCSQLVLVNIAVPHVALRPEHWIYVYDKDKLSTRINFVEKLSANNAPEGWSGIQTEVYFSRHKPLLQSPEEIGALVEAELIEMGLIDPSRFTRGRTSHRHVKLVPWANVIFDHGTIAAMQKILGWLEGFGLVREVDDLHPLTDWTHTPLRAIKRAHLFLAGRFGQWKYYWSDDCVMRGREIGRLSRQ
ncbi:MAG: FAD-dependent oxidoreductase [Paucibacter sp.]|nr:FAD-dependent oxidoreductase [Roseateles sp.]